MDSMAVLITSNIEFTGLLLGTMSGALGLVSFIGLICILVDETAKYREKQKRKLQKTDSKNDS